MIATVLAAEQIIREIEWGLPESGLGWLAMVLGTVLLLVFVVACYLRDTRDVSRLWTSWLLMLRLAVIVGLLLVFLNPRERESERTFRTPRVTLLAATALARSFPENTPAEGPEEKKEQIIRGKRVGRVNGKFATPEATAIQVRELAIKRNPMITEMNM